MLHFFSLTDRYIGRQVISALLYGVVVLSLIFVLGNLFKQIFELLVDRDLPVSSVLMFMLYILPYSLIFTIPWSLLAAVLLVFGRLSADNEFVSLRMAGMSMFRMCRPIFLLSAVLVLFSLCINTQIAPWAKSEMKQTLYNMAIEDPLALIVPDKVISQFPNYRIYAETREGEKLKGLEVIELNEKELPIRYVTAKEASIEYYEEEDQLLLVLGEAVGILKNENNASDFKNLLPGLSAELTSIPLELSSFRDDPKKLRPGNLQTKELKSRLRDDASLSQAKRNEIRTEIQKRRSLAVACFAFTLIAIPLGVAGQRRESTAGFAVSLVIACIYFLGIILADNKASESIAPYLMWLPNVILIGLGTFLFLRLARK